MFKRDKIVETKIDEEIIHMLELMDQMTAYSDEYDQMAASVAKLYELRQKDRLSMETLATVGTNLLGILMILNHERAHVIASKAFGLVKKIV